MARAPFSICERKTETGRAYFVARFYGTNGKIVKTKSFPDAKTAASAARKAEALLRDGIIANASNPDAAAYLKTFWTRESDYVRGRALRGVVHSEDYIKISAMVIHKHLDPKVKGMRLLDISADFLEGVVLDLSISGARPRTVNAVIDALRIPVKYFCKRNRLADPLASIERLAERPRERGILSVAEIQKIIALKDESPRVQAGVLLGALCGLRLGECRGLMPGDIDREAGMLTIRHNAIGHEIKGPKGSRPGSLRARQVPIPYPVLDALNRCASVAPSGASFVLWNDADHTRPIHGGTLQAGFKRILAKVGIDKTAAKSRNIVYHGLRHTFVSLQRSNGLPDFIIARMSGHRDVAMLENYSRGADNIVDFGKAREAIERAVAL